MTPVLPFKSDQPSKDGPTIDRLVSLVKDDLDEVNRLILDRLESKVDLIPTLARHLIAAGGKRIRPLLTLGSARLCGYEGDRHLKLAASVEFIHTATLLHDDVVDESDLRRGNETANVLWGNQASVLVGDFLFSRAFQLMVEDGSLEVLRILSNASAVIAEGEVMQLINTGDVETTEDAYLDVISAKTAALFAAACRVGGEVADRPKGELDALESYGRNLGIAFQLADDALDYAAEQGRLGKTIGDDFREGKITLPVLLAYRRGDAGEREFWQRVVEDHDSQTDADLKHAMTLIERHEAIADTIDRARHYGAMARDALAIFPGHPVKHALIDVIDFTVERAY